MFCNRIVLAAMIGSGLISSDALAARKCYTLTGNITVQPQVDTCTAMNFAAKFPITNTKDGFYFSAIDGLFDANHQSRCYVGQITGQLTQVNKAKETYDLSGATSYTGLIAGNVGNSPCSRKRSIPMRVPWGCWYPRRRCLWWTTPRPPDRVGACRLRHIASICCGWTPRGMTANRSPCSGPKARPRLRVPPGPSG